MKQKWYLQTWIIVLLCALWQIFIPAAILGVVLLIFQYVNNRKMSLEYEQLEQEYNETLEACGTLEELKDELQSLETAIDEKNKALNSLDADYEDLAKKLAEKYQEKRASLNEEYNTLVLDLKAKYKETHDVKMASLDNDYKSRMEELDAQYKDKHNDLTFKLGLETSALKSEHRNLTDEITRLKAELQELQKKAAVANYDFSDYDGLSSEECKNKLSVLKHETKALIKSDLAVHVDEYTSRKEINDNKKQILRCFNAECDNILVNLSTKNIDTARNRVATSFASLNRIFQVDGIRLNTKMLELKLEELNLVYTYELKHEQEKERQREIKSQMLEEEKLQREIDQQKKKIEKDLQSFSSEVKRLMKYMQNTQHDAEKQLYIDKIKELEDKLKALEAEKEHVLEREARATAGYVYIISNIGSFGEDIYKIGMTRRLEPMDRIKELSSASVPFEFDVHAMIFADDAPHLENTLHDHFKDRSVNKVNFRKEFFKVSIDEIESYVKQEFNNTTEFTKIPTAREYRETLRIESELM